MSFDPVEVFGGAVGALFKRFFYFTTAVWIGCIVGIAATVASFVAAGGALRTEMVWYALIAPVGLLNAWFFLNFAILVVGLAYSVKSEEAGFLGWMILAGLCALGVKLGDDWSFSGKWLPMLAGWAVWVAFLVMLGAGVWLLRQYLVTVWTHHLHDVQAETTVREMERSEIVRAKLEASRPPAAHPGVILDLKR